MPEFPAKKYPAIFVLLAIIAGIILSNSAGFGVWVFLSIAIALLFLVISFYHRQRLLLAGILGLLCITSLSASNFAFRYKTFPPGHIAEYLDDDRIHTIYGTLDDWPVMARQRVDLVITVDSVETAGDKRKGYGQILLRINAETSRLQYGDRVIFESRIYSVKGGRNPSGYDYRRYLNLKGIFGLAYLPNQYSLQVDPVSPHHFYRVISDLRQSIIAVFQNNLGPREAALAGGFLIGETRGIDPGIYNLFRDSGTLHLLAVSGSNVALVLLLFSLILKGSGMRHWIRSAVLIGIIFIFSFLAYNQPSVVRAAVMAVLIILGKAFQRKIEYNNIVAFAAVVILLFEPTQLYDVGFQLSFVTAWGLIYMLPKFSKVFKNILSRWYYKFIIWPFLICMVAQFFSLPLSIYYFQRIPLIGFLSNLIIVPLVSATVIGEIILLFAAMIIPALAQFVGAILNPIIEITISLLQIFGSSGPQSVHGFQVPAVSIIFVYILLAIVGMAIYSKSARRVGVVYLLVSANLLLIGGVFKPRIDGRFEILPVSGGILGFYHSRSSHLIISGLPPRDYSYAEKIILPYLQNREIDKVNLFVLTAEPQTISEVLYLSNAGMTDSIFIPFSSRTLFQDLYLRGEYKFDTSRIAFYGRLESPRSSNAPTTYLSSGQLFYSFDSSCVQFLTFPQGLDSLTTGYASASSSSIVILPQLQNADTIWLGQSAGQNPQAIVCNRVGDGIRSWKELKEAGLDGSIPQILNTSEIGAVEIVVSKGKARLAN